MNINKYSEIDNYSKFYSYCILLSNKKIITLDNLQTVAELATTTFCNKYKKTYINLINAPKSYKYILCCDNKKVGLTNSYTTTKETFMDFYKNCLPYFKSRISMIMYKIKGKRS